MGVIDMAKKSGGGKGSRGPKTGRVLTEGQVMRNPDFESKPSNIPRMHRNSRNGTLTVGKYRRISPYVNVTKR